MLARGGASALVRTHLFMILVRQYIGFVILVFLPSRERHTCSRTYSERICRVLFSGCLRGYEIDLLGWREPGGVYAGRVPHGPDPDDCMYCGVDSGKNKLFDTW